MKYDATEIEQIARKIKWTEFIIEACNKYIKVLEDLGKDADLELSIRGVKNEYGLNLPLLYPKHLVRIIETKKHEAFKEREKFSTELEAIMKSAVKSIL